MNEQERIRAEGMEAAARGHAPTHNPYIITGTLEQVGAWADGFVLVQEALDRAYDRGTQAAHLFRSGHFDMWSKSL